MSRLVREPGARHASKACARIALLAAALSASLFGEAFATEPAGASALADGKDFAGPVDIGAGRKLYLTCRGAGGPAVVLVAGYRDRGDPWSIDLTQPASGRTMVLPGVASFTRVCAYDRPGTVLDESNVSRSDPVPQPQTATDAVADLHALLAKAAVPGPYVLVGHSYGGLVVRLYASTYPAEVGGLVLVDALPALETWLTPEQWAAYQQLLIKRPAEFEDYHDFETIDLFASAAQMRDAAAAAPLRSLPLVVLSHGRPSTGQPTTCRRAFRPTRSRGRGCRGRPRSRRWSRAPGTSSRPRAGTASSSINRS